MIINETEVTERMNSPLNLLNRLKAASTKTQLTVIPSLSPDRSVKLPNPFVKDSSVNDNIPTSSDIISNLDEKLAISSTSLKNKASTIMNMAMDELKTKISDTNKPEQLAKIAAEMNKIITSETEANRGQDNRPQYVLYTPQFNQENHYETIYARE